MSRPLTKAINKDWDELVEAIPDDLEASAEQYGALQRRRGIQSAPDLLRLILMYATLLSLRNTALWAACLGRCDISRQAIAKRVLHSTAWLRHVLAALLGGLITVPGEAGGLIRRLIVVDASTLARPGSPGTEWRLHLSGQPFRQQPAGVILTDDQPGEGYDGLGLQAGDLGLSDRGYGVWRHLQAVLDAWAYFIIRLTGSNLPLLTLDGQPFNRIDGLKSLPEAQTEAEITVVAADDPHRRPLRLVVGRLPEGKAEAARERVRQQAKKKKRAPHPNTVLAAGFCILLTNLPLAACALLTVLALYRIRWQVEWCFRRWKSLCHLEQLPAYPAAIAEPVLLAKLILILLMQHRLGGLPWPDWWTSQQPAPVVSALVHAGYAYLCDVVRPARGLVELLNNPTPFLRHLRSSRRKRPLQLAEAARQLATLFAELAPAPGGA
jgi:hypothetical protein